jgi:hypothetical protein
VHSVLRPDIDVRRVDPTSVALNIDLAGVEIHVCDVDLASTGRATNDANLDAGNTNREIDVAGLGRARESHVDMPRMLNIDVRSIDNGPMQRENDAPDVEVVTDASSDTPLAVRDEPLPPVVPDRATLIRGFRLLAERIPGFTHLSPEETRKMIRASELDEELIAAALVAADVWDRTQTQAWLRMTPEELRELDTDIRDSEAVLGELRILLKGMEGANRVRKHRRGKAIFNLYRGLQISIEGPSGRNNYMRPYFENMQRAYMKTRKRKKEKEPVASPPPADSGAGSPG